MAINNYFKIFLSQAIALAETIVIKSETSVTGINRAIREVFGEDAVSDDPRTWKYYLNISGEYHPQDDMMQVISLDTLEVIDFTKENLKLHKATAKAYQYGSRQYLELVTKYPKQEMIVLGVLYPADIEEAIAAKNGTILSYPPNLVEFNEYSFINKLQDWIYLYLRQFRNPQYQVSDELVETATLGQMYLALVPAILNIRLRACKTNEAHSYHVRRYLASHGFLDEFLNHMTTKQALWCYRNINYIEKYAGQRDTFEWLIENILTDRNVPIGEYRMYHDTTSQPNGVDGFTLDNVEDGSAYYPAIQFSKTALNDIPSAMRRPYDLEVMYDKEDPLATDNERFHPDDLLDTKFKMENSLSNKLMTKVLESSMYDYTDSDAFTLSDTLINQWIWRAHNGNYAAAISVTSPVSGERWSLSSKDALYLLYYAYRQWSGQEAKYVPGFIANRVPRTPVPTVEDLRKYVPTDRISERAVQLALDLMPVTSVAYSIEDFYNESVEYWKAANLQNNLIATYEHLADRAYAENMISRIYMCYQYPAPDNGQLLYGSWLSSKSIDVSRFTVDHWKTVYEQLLAEGTGINLENISSPRNIQKAMISLFSKLSSYSVQFITDINKSNILQLEGPRVRVGDRLGRVHSDVYVNGLEVEVMDYSSKITQTVDMRANVADFENEVNMKVHSRLDMRVSNVFNEKNKMNFNIHIRVPISRVAPNHNYGRYPNRLNTAPVWRNELYTNLTEEQSYDLVDVYQRDYGCSMRGNLNAIDINQVLTNGATIEKGVGPSDLIHFVAGTGINAGKLLKVVVGTHEKLIGKVYVDENNVPITDWRAILKVRKLVDRTTGDTIYQYGDDLKRFKVNELYSGIEYDLNYGIGVDITGTITKMDGFK